MKVLITGATGFIGSHLVSLLINKGFSVSILKRKKSNLKNISCFESQINIFSCDSYNNIKDALEILKPDVVIHLATLYINKHSEDDISTLINSNITFGANLLEAMSQTKIKRFINIGTRWQHINDELYNPSNLYAATKQAFQDIMKFYEKQGIRTKTLELCDTYGQNDTRKKIVSLLIESCQKKQVLKLSPGEQILDLVYVEDVVSFIAENLELNEFYDNAVCSITGEEISLKDLGSVIEDQFGCENILLWGGCEYRENEVMSPPHYYSKVHVSKKTLVSSLRALINHV